jgi:hypothetical protein
LVNNQYSIYIIFAIIKILLDIDEEFFKGKIANTQNINKITNVNHNMKSKSKSKSSGESMEEDEEKNNESIEKDDSKNENMEEEINSINIIYKDNDISFEEFEKIRKEVLLFIDNNTQNKEKKKLINLMKLNKIENSFITIKKKSK